MNDLTELARGFFAPGRGLLAADESVASATKRLALYGVAAGEEERRKFRNLFLEADGIEQYLSGVILFSETLLQKGDDGVLFSKSLADRGIAPGIKVDEGTEPFSESPHELITKGLIGLPERLAGFKKQGAVFTKWRAVVTIEGDQLPSAQALHENLRRLASYAKEVQTAGMVPILEPEVFLEGAHSRLRAREVIQQTLSTLFSMLAEHAVDPSALIIKTAMALTGSACERKDTPQEVAQDTLTALIASVPKEVPGIVFLSGGQTPDEATDNLREIAKQAPGAGAPWPLTFSYARALQEEALAIWKGTEENVASARVAFLERLKKVSDAQQGK